MPKSVIREFDNSKAGNTPSSNFAVLVPGYLGSPKLAADETADDVLKKAKIAGIYIEDSKTYILNSTSQFIRYIGKFGGIFEDVAPTVDAQNEYATGIEQYMKKLEPADFRYLDTKNYNYYKGIEITNPSDENYGKNKYLVKTFTFTDQQATITKTYRFEVVDEDYLWRDLPTQPEADESAEDKIVYGWTDHEYFRIKKGFEGKNKNTSDHMGNQIAYELLNLGYTVYFKVLEGTGSAVSQLSNDEFWEPVKQKSVYQVRYLTTGGCYSPLVAEAIEKVAGFRNNADIDYADTHGYELGRGDVIALLDIDEDDNSIKTASTKEALLQAFGSAANSLIKDSNASKYTAIFAPRVVYKFSYPENDEYSSDIKFPASFHYLACAAEAQQRYAEWYAVAGYKRGICSLPIQYLTYTFGDIDINTLAPRKANNFTKIAINLILTERGNYYLWGNRTAYLLDSEGLIFSHFLNIRQLCCTLKQVLYTATRQLTFDPNSDILWINFVNAIRPTLERMKADQGITGYKISRVESEKKGVLVAKIRIVPIEAVEDFDISIYLEDSLEGIIIGADEEVAE